MACYNIESLYLNSITSSSTLEIVPSQQSFIAMPQGICSTCGNSPLLKRSSTISSARSLFSCVPVKISYSVEPRAKMSVCIVELESTLRGIKNLTLSQAESCLPSTLDPEKSMRYTLNPLSSKTFSGFKSPWTTPAVCNDCRAAKTSQAHERRYAFEISAP